MEQETQLSTRINKVILIFILITIITLKVEVKWKTGGSRFHFKRYIQHNMFQCVPEQTALNYFTYCGTGSIKLSEQMCLWEMGCLINLWHNVIELVGT